MNPCRTAALLALAAAACAQTAEERVKPLLVMITAQWEDTAQNGAGIIVGHRQDRLYILTANHVVRSGPREAKSVVARLHGFTGETQAAKIAEDFDPTLDLAVLIVPNASALGAATLPFRILGDSTKLERGTGLVQAMGYPAGKRWFARPVADVVSGATVESIRFDSPSMVQGYSGGGLFNDKWELVGLMRSDQPPEAEALRIERAIAWLNERQYPVQLAPVGPAPGPVPPAPDPPKPTPSATATWSGVSVSPSGERICGNTSMDDLYCWGGSVSGPPQPVDAGGEKLRLPFVGDRHACALTRLGAAYCWGESGSGQLGWRPTSSGARILGLTRPRAVSGGLQFSSLALGGNFTCGVLRGGGALQCWGEDQSLGIRSDRPQPHHPSLEFRRISAAGSTLCGIAADGFAYCWGDGWRPKIVRLRGHLERRELSEVSAKPERLPIQQKVMSISVGSGHGCAVDTMGKAYCWGSNHGGELGVPVSMTYHFAAVTTEVPFINISVAGLLTCATAKQRPPYCWGTAQTGVNPAGRRFSHVPVQIQLPEAVRAPVRLGHKSACALTESLKLYCWGDNSLGQLVPGGFSGKVSTAPVEIPVPRK